MHPKICICVVEDEHAEDLWPASRLKPCFDITCGGRRLIHELTRLGHPVKRHVRGYLRPVQAEAVRDIRQPSASEFQEILFVNARLIPSREHLALLGELLASPSPALVLDGDEWIAARLQRGLMSPKSDLDSVTSEVMRSALPRVHTQELPGSLFRGPHDILRHHVSLLQQEIEARLQRAVYHEKAPGVYLREDVARPPMIALDSSQGPILIETNVRLGPFAFLQGPLLIEPNVVIREHAAILRGTYCGQTAKLGGEIVGSVIEPYVNKQHFGYLGHAYVGSWVNLGAGTCVSDLKNTYGTIRANVRGTRVDTGMQFLGPVLGEFCRTAIQVSIYTGLRIGAASALYGAVTEDVPDFVNHAASWGSVTATTAEAVTATQTRICGRRGVVPSEADRRLIHDAYELTAGHRKDLPIGPPKWFRGQRS